MAKDTLEYLYSLGRMGIRLDLESIKKNLSVYGNPQNSFDSVLVAGTNGKGSTVSMLASILRASEYKVGLYTSPHLFDLCERITINGEKISRDKLDNLVDDLKNNLVEPLSFFEFITAVALIYFSQEKVDIAVLEVGMGGRLDATNVVNPLLSIITNIGFDHTEYLGKTLEEIAIEKAGIIKHCGILITAEESEDIQKLFKKICDDKKSKIFLSGKDFSFSSVNADLKGTSFDFISPLAEFKNIKTPLCGRHQAKNASLAVFAALKLSELKYKVSDKNIREGLKNAIWRGRLEFIHSTRTMLFDCAHNIPGILQLCEFLKSNALKGMPVNFVYGALSDKNYGEILKTLMPLAKNIILSKPDHPRSFDPEKIKKTFFPADNRVIALANPAKALEFAQKLSEKDDLICITGSIFLVADILKKIKKTEKGSRKNHEKIKEEYFYLGR